MSNVISNQDFNLLLSKWRAKKFHGVSLKTLKKYVLNTDGTRQLLAIKLANEDITLPILYKPEVLRLANDRGWTVAHAIASKLINPNLPANFVQNYVNKLIEANVLGLKDSEGQTVAHRLALSKYAKLPEEAYFYKDKDGNSVAHVIARFNVKRVLELPKDALTLRNKQGITVAHIIPLQLTTLDAKDSDIILKILDRISSPDIAQLATTKNGTTVMDNIRYNLFKLLRKVTHETFTGSSFG